ncbi:unnamed protein product [Rotaria magnacalcarata]|uniref:Nucleolar complex protein 2 homolog n=1 Tax=Rotaria magnacalcarata TaxID=392030 RepID=A0A816WEU3_9BILA|nr:unnamed protein product [Rotaria magnacalcarata]CAF1946083.1 unnamed protein product [Rotaria magnacalcarata]CAF2132278.1 unnamed protein product [Rotaria magnacalcarata]CAF2135359.1 unnamed protein product [Rotaria magnacalcarata]CAF3791146.1 unnamed protein product [Rotaria magnacalcarata]
MKSGTVKPIKKDKKKSKKPKENGISASAQHKKDLADLATVDPEFYKFLKKEDASLLHFNADEDDESIPDDDPEQQFHQLPEQLAEIEPMSEDEDENGEPLSKEEQQQVTTETIDKWSNQLQKSQPTLITIRQVIRAFGFAVQSAYGGTDVSADESQKKKKKKQITSGAIDDPESFNAIVRVCLKQLLPAIYRFLRIKLVAKTKLKPETSSNWKYIENILKKYLLHFTRLMSMINVPSTLNILLRHVRSLIPFVIVSPNTRQALVKELIHIWSTASDERSRVIAFVCLFHLIREHRKEMIGVVLRKMYLDYLKNCKFTSPTTLPLINFMQRSLVELYSLDPTITYQHGFVFLRQLAVYLRTAIQNKKQENIQSVYSWQFVHALSLWTNVIGVLYSTKEKLIQQLIHPLTELIIGTIRLVPTTRYYPLRFHCVRLLIKLTELTSVFVPVLPFLLEMFDMTDFNKRHKTATLKAQYINFDTSLKLTKLQMDDRAYKDGLMDQFYELVMLYLVHYAHHVTFPELVYPLILKCKKFIKVCKVQNFVKVIRGLLEKVQENINLIEERRQKAGLNVKDVKLMDSWLEKSRQESTSSPLVVHFQRYKSLRQREVLEDIAQKEKISTLGRSSLPDLIRPERQVAGKQNFKSMIEKEFSDNDEEEEEEELFQIKAKRKHDDIDGEQEQQEDEDDADDDDVAAAAAGDEVETDEEEDSLTSPPAKKRQAKMGNGGSSNSTKNEFLSIVKKKFDCQKDRVKTMSVDDF